MSRWWNRVRVVVRGVLRRRRAEAELNEELHYHLEREIAERVAAGATPAAARHDALRMMGAVERSKEECRDLRRRADIIDVMGVVSRDVSFGVRLFRRHPMPLGIAVAGLALAIGVVAALFSVVNAMLLRPYGMDDPASVVLVGRTGQPAWIGWGYPQYLAMRRSDTLAAIEAASDDRLRVNTTGSVDEGPARPVLFVSGGYMAALGGRPFLGRTIIPSDDVPGAPAVAVISHHLWRVAYQSDATVLGSEVLLNGTPVTIVGVMDPAFTGPVRTLRSVWVPLALHGPVTGVDAVGPTTGPRVEVVARLRSDVAPEVAVASLMALTQPPPVEGEAGSAPRRPIVLYSGASPISGFVDEDTYYGLAAVAVLAALVLVTACANAANLLMASAATRRREIGVRLALGATRRRLVGQLMTESATLACVAGGAGVLLAYWIAPVFGALAEVDPGVSVTPDVRVVLFTTVLALVCGLSTSLLPARRGTRVPVLTELQGAGQARHTTWLPSRLRGLFVGVQAAVAVLLLIVAALFTRTAVLTARVDLGFDADRLVGVSFSAPRTEFDEDAYLAAATSTITSLPAIEAVSVTQYLPFVGLSVERERLVHDGRSFVLNFTRADSVWFRTAGVDVVRGRPFTQHEVDSGTPVALISENAARSFFGERDPLGQSLSALSTEAGGRLEPATIIGIIREARLSFSDGQEYGAVVMPLSRQRTNMAGLLVRTPTPAATSRAIEDALRGIDPRVRADTRVVQEAVATYLETRGRIAWMVAPGALLALVLAVLGIFAVTTFVVGQRMEEVSVRMAFGASPWDVTRLLVGGALRPVLIGTATGVVAAYLVGRVLASQLAEISPHDPLSIAVAVLLLTGAAVVAVLMPAGRAARTNPAALMRRA